ncbi:MAG: response regulator [Microcystaceae cyanobacterium]
MNSKILIVDDEPNILILMEQILEELEEDYGVEILTATDGEEALEIIYNQKPNLIFLDIMIPKISGLEVCQRVKQNSELAQLYIILLTAKGQEFDKENGIIMGADVYMTKPFRPREVLEMSRTVLGLETSTASGQGE